ncbi:MAG: HAD family hydrolase [Bdellovibrio sp.]|nr:HAD family hydrolase [Bdellovibrio sp.]
MFKGIVFDLDGTLIDSPLCFKAIRRELDIPDGEYILEYLDTLPFGPRTEKYQKLQEIEIQAARQAIPFSGALKLLHDLRERDIRVGIFTRNCRVATQYVIESFGMDIDMTITREDAPAKPNPTGLKRFLARWCLEKHELLFVGDFRFDIECGMNAGVQTALFTNSKKGLESLNPDHIISNYENFWECLLSKHQVLLSTV